MPRLPPRPTTFFLSFAFLLSVAVGFPRLALAEAAKPFTVPVLAIDSDNADEQAEALTNALRSHLRQTPGWSLMETTQSLSMLTAAFQCPQRPDPPCLVRIGDKLKTDQFFWGVMTKVPGHQVAVELHLWTRGKPDRLAREAFSDNLKDANDDTLKRVAASVFGKLLGVATGTLAVHASADEGTVFVDGVSSGALTAGRASLTLAAGPHSIEVRAPGFASAKRPVTIEPSTTATLEVVLEAVAGEKAAAAGPGTPLPVRKIIGWSAIGAGAVLVAVGIGFGVADLNANSDLNTQRENNYGTTKPPPIQNPCNLPSNLQATPASQRGCSDINDGHTDVAVEVTTLVLGGVAAGVGIYLLATDHGAASSSPPPSTTGLRSLRFVPELGPTGGSMLVLGRF